MEKFEQPTVEVIHFGSKDVINTSGQMPPNYQDPNDNAGHNIWEKP